MGSVKSKELSNGNIGLEITYGGLEAPFGGIDSSAPPAYIDPKCFTACDGFLVVDNKLVAVSWAPLNAGTLPVLWSGTSGISLLKIGTFYSSIHGQLNYALGYIATSFTGPPSRMDYTFYITSWAPDFPSIPFDDVLTLTLFDADFPPPQASISLDVISSNQIANSTGTGAAGQITAVGSIGQVVTFTITAGGTGFGVGDVVQMVQGAGFGAFGAWIQVTTVGGGGAITAATLFNAWDDYVVGPWTSGTVEAASGVKLTINGPNGGPHTYTISAWSSGFSRQQVATAMAAAITTDPNVSASVSVDGFSLILTAITPGTPGNSVTVQDVSTSEDASKAPPFYFSCRTARNLEGGQVFQSGAAPRSFNAPVSVAEVGGTLYIANLGPMILKYSGQGSFTTSTLYQGVRVIKKFAGSLIGLGLINQLGIATDNTDMILAWTAASDLDEWAPVTNTGQVTGAGFEQLADIGDYLSGLIVSNATAYIIRAQGVSYATATGNGTLPFAINHIGLADVGEGGQVQNLIGQYDQTGVFVGNTDIFAISGGLNPIGSKIKSLLFQSLQNSFVETNPSIINLGTSQISLGGDSFPLVMISAGAPLGTPFGTKPVQWVIYLYNPSNATWATSIISNVYAANPFNFSTVVQLVDSIFSISSSAASNRMNQALAVLAIQGEQQGGSNSLETPRLFTLVEGVPNNVNSGSKVCISGTPTVMFPEEELSFGRDITVDSLYVALVADVSENVTVDFYISGTLFATQVLTPTQFNSLNGNPVELQIFPSTGTGAGVQTGHSPQLTIQITPINDAGTADVRFTKITMLASFDPAQRPT